MKSVIKISGLCKNYGPVKALNQLDLEIPAGSIFGLLGPNGSGKTTLLSIITGLTKCTAGIFHWENSADNQSINNHIGALIESPTFYPYLSGQKNLELIALNKNLPLEETQRVLQIVGLSERKNSNYETYSLGMKQRLSLASVLMGDPAVMILDEPANGLDPVGMMEFREIILNEKAKGKTIIMASHILDEIEKVCTHVAILNKGKLISVGTVKELLAGGETYIISSSDIQLMMPVLSDCNLISSFNQELNDIKICLQPEVKIEQLNKYIFERGIVLNKIIPHKKNLETQFMELVK